MTLDGGSATTSSNRTRSRAAALRASSAGRVRPASRTPLSVTSRILCAPNPAARSATFVEAPLSKRMLDGTWKVKGFIACLRSDRLGIGNAAAQLVDEHALVLAVVDGHRDHMHAALVESSLKGRDEILCRADAPS